MDSIEESTTAGQTLLFASVSCVVAMLSALQELCEGKAISHSYTCTINTLYEDLEACDYRGPLTYQSMARLPKTYRYTLTMRNDKWSPIKFTLMHFDLIKVVLTWSNKKKPQTQSNPLKSKRFQSKFTSIHLDPVKSNENHLQIACI